MLNQTRRYCAASFAVTWMSMMCGCGGDLPTENSARPSVATSPSAAEDVTPPPSSPPATKPTDHALARVNAQLIQPDDLIYRGAFRLPDLPGELNWEYSGNAMTYYPEGDPDGPDDGYPGSLFAVGHDHHQQVSELAIPVPVISRDKNPADLDTARTLQEFHDIRGGFYGELEIPRAGLEYLPRQGTQTTGKLHFAWGQHFEDERSPTHGWSELDLASPQPKGPWHLDHLTNYISGDYLFEIPSEWAARNTPGLRLASGRFRDGTWSGLGPALVAYGPWTEGNPPAAGTELQNVQLLLLYGEPQANDPQILASPDRQMTGFRESDDWTGGAWLTSDSSAAVVIVGTKATGKAWYGFSNGVVYPTSGDPSEPVPDVPPWPHDGRGWWSEGIEAQMLFYDPDDLAKVAQGAMKTWEPQPYATLSIDRFLFDPGYNHPRQKRYILGAAAFDRARGILYLLERRADEEKSIIHAFAIAAASRLGEVSN